MPPKKKADTIDSPKIVQLIPAPAGMCASYSGVNAEGQPINAAQQVAAMALYEDGHVRALTLHELSEMNAGFVPNDLEDSGMVLSHYTI